MTATQLTPKQQLDVLTISHKRHIEHMKKERKRMNQEIREGWEDAETVLGYLQAEASSRVVFPASGFVSQLPDEGLAVLERASTIAFAAMEDSDLLWAQAAPWWRLWVLIVAYCNTLDSVLDLPETPEGDAQADVFGDWLHNTERVLLAETVTQQWGTAVPYVIQSWASQKAAQDMQLVIGDILDGLTVKDEGGVSFSATLHIAPGSALHGELVTVVGAQLEACLA